MRGSARPPRNSDAQCPHLRTSTQGTRRRQRIGVAGRGHEPSLFEQSHALCCAGRSSTPAPRETVDTRRVSRSQVLALLPDALDLLPSIVMIVGRGASLEFANAAGRIALARGNVLSVNRGRVVGATAESDRMWREALDEVMREDACSEASSATPTTRRCVALPAPGEVQPWILALSRGPNTESGPHGLPTATVFANDPDAQASLDPIEMRQLFGLTQTECRVAERIVNARAPRDAAEDEGMSWHTARQHLKSIFGKTQVTSQLELMRRLLGELPGVRRGACGHRE